MFITLITLELLHFCLNLWGFGFFFRDYFLTLLSTPSVTWNVHIAFGFHTPASFLGDVYRGSYPRVNRTKREASRSTKSIPVVKTEWRCTSNSASWRRKRNVFFVRCVSKIVKSDCQLRHVCPSVRPHGTTLFPLDGFSWNLSIFQKSFQKIQFSLKSNKSTGYCTWRSIHSSYHISLNSS